MYLLQNYCSFPYLSIVANDPVIEIPQNYVSGQKAALTLNRTTLSALDIVQNHPIFSEMVQWVKVQAIYENQNIPYGDTDRITGVRFRGTGTLIGRFKVDAETGDTYVLKRIFISDGNSNRLRVSRNEFETPEALDITVS